MSKMRWDERTSGGDRRGWRGARRTTRWASPALACATLLGVLLGTGSTEAQIVLTLDSPVEVLEGNAGTTDAVFDIMVQSGCGVGPGCGFDFETLSGLATSGVDFGPPDIPNASGIVDGETVRVTVPVFGDTTPEGDEDFSLRVCGGLIVPRGGCGPVITDFPALILEDDILVSIDSAAVDEGDTGTTDLVFTLSVSTRVFADVAVDFGTVDGSATVADGDYVTTSGRRIFTPTGPLTQTIAVPVNGDIDFEVDETFTLELTNASGGVVDVGVGTGTIRNDDAAPIELSIDDVALEEGDRGTQVATLTATLAQTLNVDAVVDFSTVDGTATVSDGDYTGTSGTLTLPAGTLSGTIDVTVAGDRTVESDETFSVELTVVSPLTQIDLVDGVGEVTILNDDGAGLSIGDVEVVEGDSGTVAAELEVVLSNESADQVSVRYATRDGDATVADGDYAATSGEVVLAAGQTRATITVPVNGDVEVEGDEAFSVILSAADGATITNPTGDVSIVDDDEASTLTLLGPLAVGEADGAVSVEVERAGGLDGAAQVQVSVGGGTASAGADFTATTQQLSWGAGEGGIRSFSVAIVDDNLEEGDETFSVALGAASGAVLVAPTSQSWTIVDDDVPMALEVVGGADDGVQVGDENELQVLVTREDGSPVAGTAVTWRVEGPAELLDGETTTTDSEGLASNRLRLGPEPGEVTITATLDATGTSVSFTFLVVGNLVDLFDPAANPNERSVAGVLDRSCAEASGPFADLCRYLFALGDGDRIAVVSALTPNEIAAQGNLALDGPRGQFREIGRRLAALRGGVTRRTEEQLALVIDDQPITMAAVRNAFVQYMDEDEWIAEKIAKALAVDSAAGGAPSDEPEEASGFDDLPRLGVFVSGRLTAGDRDPTDREEGWDFQAEGLTAGIDYRLSDRTIVGAALGYLKTDVDLDRDGGGADIEGYSLGLYGSYYRDRAYVDAVVGFGSNDYELVRNVDLPAPFAGQSRFTALGDPGADQFGLHVEAGYARGFGATEVSGFARGSYVDAAIDGYVERGAGVFNLAIDEQDLRSFLLEAGVELTRTASVSWGVLQPILRASYLHELEDDTRLVRGRFTADALLGQFVVETDAPDRDFLNLGVGLHALFPGGTSAFILYDTDLARDDLSIYTVSVGVRFDLR